MTNKSEDGIPIDAAHALCAVAADHEELKGVRLDAVSAILNSVGRGHEAPEAWRGISAEVAAFLITVIDDGTDTQAHRFQAAECLVQGAERGWWRVPARFL